MHKGVSTVRARYGGQLDHRPCGVAETRLDAYVRLTLMDGDLLSPESFPIALLSYEHRISQVNRLIRVEIEVPVFTEKILGLNVYWTRFVRGSSDPFSPRIGE